MAYRKNAIDMMARVMWGEARSDGAQGMRAVGHVIMNRAEMGGWWGRSVIEVIYKDKQFSAMNVGDPNRDRLLSVTEDDSNFVAALELAEGIYTGQIEDNTGGATHYHTKAINPYWSASGTKTATIGDHVFYRGVG